MKDIFEIIDWKRITAVLGSALIIVTGLSFILNSIFRSNPPNSPQTEVTQPSVVQQLSPTPRPYELVAAKTLNWKGYKTKEFQIEYPSIWIPEPYTITTGGIGVSLRLGKDVYFPEFHLEVVQRTDGPSLEQRMSQLSWMNLRRRTVTLFGSSAVSLDGVLPFRGEVGNPDQKQIYKRYIFSERPEKIVIITYSYFQDTSARNLDQQIQAILSSIQIF
jgi:hypothetical protein